MCCMYVLVDNHQISDHSGQSNFALGGQSSPVPDNGFFLSNEDRVGLRKSGRKIYYYFPESFTNSVFYETQNMMKQSRYETPPSLSLPLYTNPSPLVYLATIYCTHTFLAQSRTLEWWDAVLQKRLDWGHCLFCCYQPSCVVSQELFCVLNFPILPPLGIPCMPQHRRLCPRRRMWRGIHRQILCGVSGRVSGRTWGNVDRIYWW